VRLVLKHGGDYPSEWAAIESIAGTLGMTKKTLRRWVRRVELEARTISRFPETSTE